MLKVLGYLFCTSELQVTCITLCVRKVYRELAAELLQPYHRFIESRDIMQWS